MGGTPASLNHSATTSAGELRVNRPHMFEDSRMRVEFFQEKHASVGGDWMGSRYDKATETTTVVVADATGKGVQAALVIHALQSLWADSLDNPLFDPEKWIQRVNNTLVRLGEQKPHTMTMGLLQIEGNHIHYWCCAHIPLYAFIHSSDKTVIKPLLSSNSILGTQSELSLRKISLSVRTPCSPRPNNPHRSL